MGIAERKTREKEQRRESIIDAAETFFFNKDYASTTMSQIADKVELNKATLYLYFENKNDLFHAIVYRVLSTLLSRFQDAVVSRQSGLDKISSILQTYRDFIRKHPEYSNVLHHRDENRNIPAPGKRTRYDILTDDMGVRVFDVIKDAVDRGVADGSIRRDVDSRRLAVNLWSQAYGTMAHVHDNEDFMENVLGASADEVIDSSFEIIINYLRGES